MTMHLKFAALLLPVGAAGCSPSTSVQHTNEATTDQLDAISNNTSETDGQTATTAPGTPDELGQSMRSGATKPPQR